MKKRSWIERKLNLSNLAYIRDVYKYKYYTKTYNESKKYIFPFITLSATKEYLKYMDRMNWARISHLGSFKQVHRNILSISIRKVPTSRLEDMYPEAKPLVSGKVLEFSTQSSLKIRYLFISDIKSIEEFNKELEIICGELI